MHTDQEQRTILREAVRKFIHHQKIATDLLDQINAIGLLENEGNPFTRSIKGEDDLHATIGLRGKRIFASGEFADIIENMKRTADMNGHIV